ncbi:hypothetical protein LSAT2_019054 [Lamellibrachia satsuma]|nr:hypothetical protein LSAT2_019054 [Lamellibrachia satsuma]
MPLLSPVAPESTSTTRSQLQRVTVGCTFREIASDRSENAESCEIRGNDQVDVRVVESDETEEDGLVYGNRHVTEKETRPDAPSQGRRHDVQKRATPVEVSASKRKRAKKNRRRLRKRGIKALHMEAQMPSSVGPITGDDVRALDLGGKLTKDGYSPPPGEDHDDMKFRYWTAAQWTRRFAPKHHYNPTTGQTAVHEGGLYFVYSQITISFDGVRWGYSLYVDNDPVFTCVSQKPKNASNEVLTNTCTTSGVVLLTSGQTISIGVQNEDIRAVMKAKLSYWGMIKLANIPKARE